MSEDSREEDRPAPSPDSTPDADDRDAHVGEELAEELRLGAERSEDVGIPHVVIITGLSGSGKTTAVWALEDAGFFCIDNLPVPLLPKVLELAGARDARSFQHLAFVVDTRERTFLDEATEVISQLRDEGITVRVLFLDADDEELVRRFSETRRRHPMSDGGTVRDGIQNERRRLTSMAEIADYHIDTTQHTPHTLKAYVQELFQEATEPSLTVAVMSFGFKHGLPSEAELVFDLRFLPNPYYIEEMRPRSGLDEDVRDYVLGFPETGRFISLFQEMTEFMLPLYEREGKSYLTIGIGCTGGQHRSVAVSEAIGHRLRGRGWNVVIRHRDARLPH